MSKNETDDIVNILRQFNEQSNNKLTIENINYLDSLSYVITNSIEQLSNFNVNTNKIVQITSLYGNNVDIHNFNDIIKMTTINFLKSILGAINNLKLKPIRVKSICVRDEYHNFHNNIIKKIKEFINYYRKYVIINNDIKCNINKKVNDDIDNINIIISNYNNNSVCREDPNFNRNISRLRINIDLLKDYSKYLDININIFIFIRISFKNINTSFLKMLQN